MTNTTYKKIMLPARPQPDTIVAIFLLKKFGKNAGFSFESVDLEIVQDLPKNETPESLARKGILALDLGAGKFDHHKTGKTLSQIIAEELGVLNLAALAKLLNYAERDDKFGVGTISSDQLDKAFGLSGIIAALNKTFPQDPKRVVNAVLPLVDAHFQEEKKRTEDLPKEFEEKLKKSEAEVFDLKQGKKALKIVFIQSDNISLSGWLKSSEGIKADVVCQKMSAGYTNILTRPLKKIDLRWPTAYIRYREAEIKGKKLNYLTPDLMKPGRIPEVPEWYYDRATNSILNGGSNPNGVSPTAISIEEMKIILKDALSQTPIYANHDKPLSSETTNKQYFLEIRLPLEKANEIKNMIGDFPIGFKSHLPENYHITIFYLGSIDENFEGVLEKITNIIKKVKPFEIIIDGENFKSGEVPGYQTKTFYFEIKDSEGGNSLKKIREVLEKNLPDFKKENFFPHLTVASVKTQIDEKVITEAKTTIDEKRQVGFTVEKIRLTEASKKSTGEVVYKIKSQFYL